MRRGVCSGWRHNDSAVVAALATTTAATTRSTPWSPLHTAVRAVGYMSYRDLDHPAFSYRRRHTFNTLPMHDANRFGGRTAYLREIGPINHKTSGRHFKRDYPTLQYNVDVWAAQQTLRKRWKARDWDVVELPFALAPRELQRVLPEMYTDVPQMSNPAAGDYSNVRSKVYDREELQDALYGGCARPYPMLQRTDTTAMTLDKFL